METLTKFLEAKAPPATETKTEVEMKSPVPNCPKVFIPTIESLKFVITPECFPEAT
jgi:hypothetical protein